MVGNDEGILWYCRKTSIATPFFYTTKQYATHQQQQEALCQELISPTIATAFTTQKRRVYRYTSTGHLCFEIFSSKLCFYWRNFSIANQKWLLLRFYQVLVVSCSCFWRFKKNELYIAVQPFASYSFLLCCPSDFCGLPNPSPYTMYG